MRTAAAGLTLVFVASLSGGAGCRGVGPTLPGRPTPPPGAIVLPAVDPAAPGATGALHTLPTRALEVLIHAPDGSPWVLAPDALEWQPLVPSSPVPGAHLAADRGLVPGATASPSDGRPVGDGSLARLDTTREGDYLLAPPGPQPSHAGAAVLCLQVDRTPPRALLSTSWAGDPPRLIVHWSIEDRLPLAAPGMQLLHSRDDRRTWMRLGDSHPSHGTLDWTPPPGEATGQWLRIEGSDAAGNGFSREAPLGETPPALAPDALSQDAAQRPPDWTALWADHPVPPLYRVMDTAGGATEVLLAAGARLTVPPTCDPQALRIEDSAGLQLDVVVDEAGGWQFPSVDDGSFTLALECAGQRWHGLRVHLDGTPPRVERFEALGGLDGVRLRWRVADLTPTTSSAELAALAVPRAWLLVRQDGEPWREESLPGPEGERHWPLAPGHYELALSAVDAAGNRSAAAGPVLACRVGGDGPEPLNFSGEVFAAGASHLLFLRRGDPAEVSSEIEVRLLELPGERMVREARLPAGTTQVLLQVPERDGRYLVEVHWLDAHAMPRVLRGRAPFLVDATPPRVRWGTMPFAVARAIELELRHEGEQHESGVVWRFLRRAASVEAAPIPAEGTGPVAPSRRPWEAWPTIPELRMEPGGLLRVLADFGSWPEGSWELAVDAADALGNRSPEPLVGGVVEVDRTAPSLTELELPARTLEGISLSFRVRDAQRPAQGELLWFREQAPTLRRELDWKPHELGGWLGTAAGLPPGTGRLLIAVADAATNRAERSGDLQVLPAVRQLRVEPGRVVEQAAPLFVSYELEEPLPFADQELELRIEAPDGRVARVQPIIERRRRLVVEAPMDPDTYRVGIAPSGGPLFESSIVPLVVRRYGVLARSEFRGLTPPEDATTLSETASAAPSRSSAITSPGGQGVEVDLQTERLLAAFTAFQSRWQLGERGAASDAERHQLLGELQADLVREPLHAPLRQALARLLTFSTEPDLDGASWVLEQGVELGLSGPDRAAVLSDLGVIRLQRRDFDSAERALAEAIELQDSARRRYNLAQVQVARGRYEQAEAELARAVALDPTLSVYQRNWARAAARLEGPEGRQRAMRRLEDWHARGWLTPVQRRELEHLVRTDGQASGDGGGRP